MREGSTTTVGNRDIRRSVEERGMGLGTVINKMDTTGTFRKENGI